MIITTKTAAFSLHEKGFVYVEFLQNNEVFDVEEAHAHINAASTVSGNKKLPVLIDVTKSYYVPSPEAKQILAEFHLKTAEVIVVSTLAHQLLSNFYIKILKKCNANHPVKVFVNKNKAIDWLTSHL